jgi:hypothetical protein
MSAILSAHSFEVVEIILSHLALLSLSIQFDIKYHAHAPSIPHGIPPTVPHTAAHALEVIVCCNFDGL